MSNTKAGLKPYPAYKELEIPWLGKVPTHWTVAETKNFYEIQMGKMLQPQPAKTTDIEVPYLKAVNVQWYSVQTDNAQTMWASPEEIEQLQVIPGDLLVCEGGEGGRAGIAKAIPNGFIIQNALHRVRPKRAGRNELLQHLMKVISETGWFDAINNKATIAHFTKEKFASLPIPVPPLEEQDAIVRYLDDADQRIRAYVSAKERLIALLAEQRQAVIHQAVTQGLDPNVKLKPSGVEWLGGIPDGWDLVRIKSVARVRYGLGQPPPEKDGGLPLIRATNVSRGHILEHDMVYVDPQEVPQNREAFLSEGEIIVVRSGAYTADSAIIPPQYNGAVTGYDMVLKPTEILPEFLGMALLTNYLRDDQLIINSTRAAQPHLNAEELGNALIILPPKEEQINIAMYLDDLTASIDTAVAQARRQIELMQEHRTRLTADVVTGKIDVREAKP